MTLPSTHCCQEDVGCVFEEGWLLTLPLTLTVGVLSHLVAKNK